MVDSILTSTKKVLGIAEDYTAFDPDILMHVNSVFSTLVDLGIGPDDGFMIEDASTTWGDYLGTDKRLNNVKTYVYLRVRMLFDPPTTSYLLDAMSKQIQELEWRINVQRENRVHPDLVVIPDPDLDGGEVETDPLGGWVFDGGRP